MIKENIMTENNEDIPIITRSILFFYISRYIPLFGFYALTVYLLVETFTSSMYLFAFLLTLLLIIHFTLLTILIHRPISYNDYVKSKKKGIPN